MSAAQGLHLLIALVLGAAAVAILRSRGLRAGALAASFWGLLAALVLVADRLPASLVGFGVVLLAVLAPRGGARREVPPPRSRSAGPRLFGPALAIPLITVALVIAFQLAGIAPATSAWLGGLQPTLLALALACALALAMALRVTAEPVTAAGAAGAGLLEAMGWAAILPLVLAALGAVFAAAGVGEIVAQGVVEVVPVASRWACVLAYGLGMAAFTMIMGNAFAAFPVLTAGVGLPLLVGQHGAEPASTAAIGMLCGYCGTLMTPMAANYNIVPAALLGLDQHAVIRAQLATALPLLAANLVLLGTLPFR